MLYVLCADLLEEDEFRLCREQLNWTQGDSKVCLYLAPQT